jgi:DNA-binding PadR family transcriptional regulator
MSSSTRLLVLGVVRLFQPVHGYVVRRELLSWRAQEWASIQPGSIYNALKTLTRDGLLEVASTDQVGGRPERTTYRLTKAGQEEFHTLLREQWWTVHPPVDPLMAAVSFLGEISRAEAIAALEHRAAQVHGMVRAVEFAIENHDDRESPDHVREMMRLMNARVSSELDWSQRLIERLRRGEYATGDEPPWHPPARPEPGRGARNGRPPGDRTRRGSPPREASDRPARRIVRKRDDRTGQPARGSSAAVQRAPSSRAAGTANAAPRTPDTAAHAALPRSDRASPARSPSPSASRSPAPASSPAARRSDSRSSRAAVDHRGRDARQDRRVRSRGPRR